MPQADEPTTPQNASRRRFLQGAAIATATAATATAAGAAIASASHQNVKHLIQTFNPLTGGLSAVTCSMCIENSSFTQITTLNANGKGNGTQFIWFTAENLPLDSYTLSYTLNGNPFNPTSTSSTPFALASKGNNAFLFENAAGKSSTCPSADPSDQDAQGFDLSSISPSPTTEPVTGDTGDTWPADLQFKLHVTYDGTYSSKTTLTFIGTLKNSSGTTVCTASYTITLV
jgi:hypothetical protein